MTHELSNFDAQQNNQMEEAISENDQSFKVTSEIQCPICQQPHHVQKCYSFNKATTAQRYLYAVEKKLCQNCLKIHLAQPICPAAATGCYKCAKMGYPLEKHNTLLHNLFIDEHSGYPRSEHDIAKIIERAKIPEMLKVHECTLCGDNHSLRNCPKFGNASAEQQFKFVEAKKICINCLNYHPNRLYCPDGGSCPKCLALDLNGRHHNSLLHSYFVELKK